MAATTISRTAYNMLVDDDGSGTTGTAWSKTNVDDILDAVDGLFSTLGTTTFESGGAGGNIILVSNTTAGVANFAAFRIGNDGSTVGQVALRSTSYTTAGAFRADGLDIFNNGAGGLNIIGGHATTGYIRFYNSGSADANLRAYFDPSGHFLPGADNTYNLGQTTGSNIRWKDILAVTKTSVLDVPWGSGTAMVSVLEGPEYRLYDCGSVRLNLWGRAFVELDEQFNIVTNTESMPYQVLTGAARVTGKQATGFWLQGRPLARVDWMVIAVRAGFENIRFRDPNRETREPLGLQLPQHAIARKHAHNNLDEEPDTWRTVESSR